MYATRWIEGNSEKVLTKILFFLANIKYNDDVFFKHFKVCFSTSTHIPNQVKPNQITLSIKYT